MPPHWLTRADAERRRGQYEAALRAYCRALEDDRLEVSAWAGQVQMLVFLDEAPEAELWARKALELFPACGELLASRAQAACRQGKLETAQRLSDASLTATGESAFRWLARAELMLALGASTHRHCVDKACGIDGDWLAMIEAASMYRHYGQPAHAHALARQALERESEQAFAWYIRGCCEADLGFRRAARISFARCLELAPGHDAADRALRRLGHWGGVRAWWRWVWRPSA